MMKTQWAWLAVLFGVVGCSAGISTGPSAGTGTATGTSTGSAAGPATGAAAADTGAGLYNGNCVACHQADGRGLAAVYPSLSGSPVVTGDPQALALWVIRGVRPDTLPAGRFAAAMPKFGWLRPAQAAALFTYLRTHFGNASSPVDAALVARVLGES